MSDLPIIVGASALGLAIVLDSAVSHAGLLDVTRGASDPASGAMAAGTGQGANLSAVARVASAVQSAVDPTRRNTGAMPTAEQDRLVRQKWARKGRTAGPLVIVPRIRTYPPRGATVADLRPYAQAAARVVGSARGGTVMAVLLSLETNAGMSDSPPAFWNNNVGNIKAWTNFAGPTWFLVDRANSLDVYPSWNTLEDGIRDAWRLLSNANYNRAGMMGARRAIVEGNLVETNRALGVGGYARMYRDTNPGVFRSRYNYLANRRRVLDTGL